MQEAGSAHVERGGCTGTGSPSAADAGPAGGGEDGGGQDRAGECHLDRGGPRWASLLKTKKYLDGDGDVLGAALEEALKSVAGQTGLN